MDGHESTKEVALSRWRDSARMLKGALTERCGFRGPQRTNQQSSRSQIRMNGTGIMPSNSPTSPSPTLREKLDACRQVERGPPAGHEYAARMSAFKLP